MKYLTRFVIEMPCGTVSRMRSISHPSTSPVGWPALGVDGPPFVGDTLGEPGNLESATNIRIRTGQSGSRRKETDH